MVHGYSRFISVCYIETFRRNSIIVVRPRHRLLHDQSSLFLLRIEIKDFDRLILLCVMHYALYESLCFDSRRTYSGKLINMYKLIYFLVHVIMINQFPYAYVSMQVCL